MMKNIYLKKLVYAAMFLAIGLILPFFTGQIQRIGNMLLPMHIPVFLCGLICGWQYGAAVGFIVPLLRSVSFGMPMMYPNAVAMAFELAAYGFLVGLSYQLFKKKNILSLYASMLIAMLGGRIIWGLVQTVLLGFGGKTFAFSAFITSGFLNAIPGIILQLVLIPSVMLIIKKTHLKVK